MLELYMQSKSIRTSKLKACVDQITHPTMYLVIPKLTHASQKYWALLIIAKLDNIEPVSIATIGTQNHWKLLL